MAIDLDAFPPVTLGAFDRTDTELFRDELFVRLEPYLPEVPEKVVAILTPEPMPQLALMVDR